jgi:HNH endonuclease
MRAHRTAGVPLTQERLRELLDYDPVTGVFRRKINCGSKGRAGSVAGRIRRDGYWRIHIDYGDYAAHRLAFFWMTGKWPLQDVDHINLCRTDNRWENLREASRSQNMFNSRAPSTNSSGIKGVYRSRDKWMAGITVSGKFKNLGYFSEIEDAAAAYYAAAKKYGGEFARAT